MATHSSILAGRISWTEKPGGLYSPQGCKESDRTELLHFHFHFHSLTFSPCVHLALKWVSYRQDIDVSFFFFLKIQSATLYLLIWAFNQLTYKVIIDWHVFIDILFLVFCFMILLCSCLVVRWFFFFFSVMLVFFSLLFLWIYGMFLICS